MRTSWILIAPVFWGRCASADSSAIEPVEQVLLLVLEADVQDVGLAARGDVARHLERHRRLAGALGPADEHQLAGPQAAADGLVEQAEPERDRLILAEPAAGEVIVQIDQDVQRRARDQAAVVRVEPPGARRMRRPVGVSLRRLVGLGGQRAVPPAGNSPSPSRGLRLVVLRLESRAPPASSQNLAMARIPVS